MTNNQDDIAMTAAQVRHDNALVRSFLAGLWCGVLLLQLLWWLW